MKRLHIVDGTYELFRAHYSQRPGKIAPDGQDVKATAGVMSSMLGLIADPAEEVTHIAVAFDNPIESFRNNLFGGYKTGEGMAETLVAQMDLVEEAVAALGIVVWSMAEFEADDALATAALLFREDVEQIRIMSPDKDFGQCVTGTRVVQVDRMRQRVIDENGVRERNGVDPASIPDWLALVGDTADGIPGVPGFGAKSAAVLLDCYGTVEKIPDDPDLWKVKVRGAPRLAATLSRLREEVVLYKKLATLREDVPIRETFDDLCWRGAPKRMYDEFAARIGGFNIRPGRFDGERG
ncbi:MAG: flap endonuclease [Gammaproteobacteria bacterium]|nr:flap endonuclease [Gammaproteobacteria bacterium]